MTLSEILLRLRRQARRLLQSYRRNSPYPVILPPSPGFATSRGRVLYSYLQYPLLWPESAPELNGHSNLWESREIARIFQSLGFQVEAIHWGDHQFVPEGHYEVVFDIYTNLGRLSPYLDDRTAKILHCTGSDPYYQNAAELQRVEAVNQRRNGQYKPKRMVADPEQNYRSMQVADACSLLGSEYTRRTYPQFVQEKMELVTVSASNLGSTIKSRDQYVPEDREFLWFFGGGAVHKGLDLLLEVFSRNPNLTLNVVGNVASEKDFVEMYEHELLHSMNIHYHGYLLPSSPEFQKICRNSFCFISPTCSEGISPAVVTCLQIGLFPILSRDTGVDLPENCGVYLERCSIDEIEGAVNQVYNMPAAEVSDQISVAQGYAARQYSRQKFRQTMEKFITMTLERHAARLMNPS